MNAAPLVCLVGDESFLVDRALAELEAEVLVGGDARLNREVFEAPQASAAEVVAAARTLPFLGAGRLVVLKSAHRWSAEDWKPLLPYLESPNPSTCLVFVADQIDRRLAAGKRLVKVARVVECRKPREREMLGWAQRLAAEAGLKLAPPVLESLVARVEPDLQLLSREVEKLRAFAGDGGAIGAEDVEALVGDSRGTNVFALCNALGEGNLEAAVRSLRKLLYLGEPPAKLLYMVVRHFRHLWIGRELLGRGRRPDPRAAASLMGVPPFAAEKALAQARRWDEDRLREAFERFLRADRALKTGGAREVLEALLLALCRSPDAKRPGRSRGA